MSEKIEYLIDCLRPRFLLKSVLFSSQPRPQVPVLLFPRRSGSRRQREPWQTLLVLILASAIVTNDILAVYVII